MAASLPTFESTTANDGGDDDDEEEEGDAEDALAVPAAAASSAQTTHNNTLWSAADRGDTEKVRLLLSSGRDVNARNCLGCTPLLYACGSGHADTVRLLLSHPAIDVNRRNNDRLTSFMLAMQAGSVVAGGGSAAGGQRRREAAWSSNTAEGSSSSPALNAQEKMRRLMDLPATEDLEWTRQDRWTALMEACNFGHQKIVELLVEADGIDFEAVNLRGQRADQVASSRGHDHLRALIRGAASDRENPEELPRIRRLEEEVAALKAETRSRLVGLIEGRCAELREAKNAHEREIEPVSLKIDRLQRQLEEAMTKRMEMITRHVREVKAREEDIRQVRRKLENFDRYAASAASAAAAAATAAASASHRSGGGALETGLSSSHPELSALEKEFECSVCLEEMRPPVKIFQCRNGHVLCEECKEHPEVNRCPCCRVPLRPDDDGEGEAGGGMLRNFPMEKLAASYYASIRPASASLQQSPAASRAVSRPPSRAAATAAAAVAGLSSRTRRGSSQTRQHETRRPDGHQSESSAEASAAASAHSDWMS